MRSPWKLIKGLASRRKHEESEDQVDDAVTIPDPRTKEPVLGPTARETKAPQSRTKLNANNNVSGMEGSFAGGEVEQVVTDDHMDPSLFERRSDSIEQVEAIVSAAIGAQPAERESSQGASIANPKEPSERRVRRRKNAGKQLASKVKIKQPVAVIKTALDEASERDLEIQELRSRLSAKLIEQNAQLRRMLARYGDY